MTFPTGDRLSALGPRRLLGMIPRTQLTSPHPGSKKRYTHLTDVAQDEPRDVTPRRPHADPMGALARLTRYAAANGDDAAFICPGNLLPPEAERYVAGRLTPAQLRRFRHKHGRNVARQVLGFDAAEREAQRVTRAHRARHARRAQHLLRQIVPQGPVSGARGGLGRRARRVVESAPSVYVNDPPPGFGLAPGARDVTAS